MEYWWKENKGYVIPVAAGAIVVLVWWAYVLSGIETEAKRLHASRTAAEQALERQMAAGVPSEDVVNRAKRDLERASKLLGELRQEMSLRLPDPGDAKKTVEFPQYRPPGSKTPADFFQSHKEEVRKRIQDAASQSGVGLPGEAVGFPSVPEGMPDAVALEWLARLSMVERLAMTAVQAGVSKIDTVNAVVDAKESEEPSIDRKMFLNRLSVRMKVVGPSTAVFMWLHSVQKKGEFLAVTDFKTTKESPHEDIFSAEMEVSGLVLDPKGSLVELKE